jgi:hypothetical protein
MWYVKTALLCIVALSVLVMPQARANVLPNQMLPLTDGAGNNGGFVQVSMNATDDMRIVVSLKGVAPNTLYTVWIADCTAQGPPGNYPCPAGGALNDGPGVFGTNSPFCPVPGEGGPLALTMTNRAGISNTGGIIIHLAGVAFPGVHYAHVNVGVGCVPAPAYPPGFYATPGFSFTI